MFEFTIVIHNIFVYLQLVHHLQEAQEAQEAPLISEDEKKHLCVLPHSHVYVVNMHQYKFTIISIFTNI